jgi:hypothetical protein
MVLNTLDPESTSSSDSFLRAFSQISVTAASPTRPLYNTIRSTFRRIQDRHVGFSRSQELIGVFVPEELVDELMCLP